MMMEMQDVKARKPHSAAAAAADELPVEELDPSVQTAPLLSERNSSSSVNDRLDQHHQQQQRRRHSKNVKSWVQYVLDRVWSAAFLAVASFGLYEAQFVHEVLYAPEANRAWVNAGIFCATLVVLFGCYIELYRSMLLGEKVSYETAKTSTHGMLASMLLTGATYVAAFVCRTELSLYRSLALSCLSVLCVWTMAAAVAGCGWLWP